LKEVGKALTMIQPPNPYLEIEISMEEIRNHQWGGLETESSSWGRKKQSEALFWRERERESHVTGGFIDRQYRSDWCEKLV
jgi:hypothetical protein